MLPDMVIKDSSSNKNLSKMKEDYENSGFSQILLGKVGKKEVSQYGIAKISDSKISQIIEKPSPHKAPSNLFVVGRYIFENSIFSYLSKSKISKSGEIELTEGIQKFINDGNEMHFSHLSGKAFDCGNKLGYLKAVVEFALDDKIISKDFKSYLAKLHAK